MFNSVIFDNNGADDKSGAILFDGLFGMKEMKRVIYRQNQIG